MEGNWHFLGACEPEPILDRGWFNSAASRAMLVCSRTFFDFVDQGLEGEALTQRQGMCRMYNQTARYAQTARVQVAVQDAGGRPAPGALVRFFVVNMAGAAQIAALETGEDGTVCLETGIGSLRFRQAGGTICLVRALEAADGSFASCSGQRNRRWAAGTGTSMRRLEIRPDAFDWNRPGKSGGPEPAPAGQLTRIRRILGPDYGTGETRIWTGCSGWPEMRSSNDESKRPWARALC